MKKLEEQLMCSTSGKTTQLFVSSNILTNQKAKVERLRKHIFVLESAKEYMAYILTKKMDNEQLHKRVGIPNNFVTYSESFLKRKGRLIKDLKGKLSVSEQEIAHSTSIINKIMTSFKNLNEILNSTKILGNVIFNIMKDFYIGCGNY